jgi:uncharacterized protein
MVRRFIEGRLLAALQDTPAVFLHGARQVGKSTLVRHLAETRHPGRYLTLDDLAVMAAARQDPAGFLAGTPGPVVLDEVQRAPELFLAIKAEIDRERRPGRFLLTGSANVLLLPRVAESLAGRMEILPLWPFSQGERAGDPETFLDNVFAAEFQAPDALPGLDRTAIGSLLLAGGYPTAIGRTAEDRRQAWFGSYLTAILERDVRDMAQIEALTALPRLMALLAARTASLVNFSELSRSTAIPQTTLKRYFALLEATFLVQVVPAWSSNQGKRLVKSPKLFLIDTGLAAYLAGLNEARLAAEPGLPGALLENFVAMELIKQAGWSHRRPRLFHFRQATGQEVDLVLEDSAGEIVGVEVKASSRVSGTDFRGLRALAEAAEPRFRRGIVLYTGATPVAFGRDLHALPLSTLWQ